MFGIKKLRFLCGKVKVWYRTGMANEAPPSTMSLAVPLNSLPPITKRKKLAPAQGQGSDVLLFLQSLPEFADISPSELNTLAQSSRFSDFESGEFIANEGEEEGLNGFIVVSGRVAMLKHSTSGKELIVELLQTGDIFGLLLTLAADKLAYQLSARALGRTKVLWLSINSFVNLIKGQPLLSKAIVAHLLLCLQSSYRLSRGLAHDRVDVRIAAVLSSLALKFSRSTTTDRPYTLDFTRQQLADLTGTTSETAIRVTRAMQHDGLIDIKRPGVIRIVNLEALHALCET